jgi:hypothetical protein
MLEKREAELMQVMFERLVQKPDQQLLSRSASQALSHPLLDFSFVSSSPVVSGSDRKSPTTTDTMVSFSLV